MKKFMLAIAAILLTLASCKTTGSMANIEPKSGEINLPQKGEYRIWRDIQHPRFAVTLSNPSATQSCEVYIVTSNGYEKWVSPSLMAGKSLEVTVPSNGHLFFKNFNPNELSISYKITE